MKKNLLQSSPAYAYKYKNALYLNITSRCPTACKFCIKYSWKYLYRSRNLRIIKEPTVAEILDSVSDPSQYSEIVFCGYGESTYRLKEMKEIAACLKAKGSKKIRLNTNGFGNMIHGRNIVPELAKFLDAISISLNTTDPKEWLELHRPQPQYRKKGFKGVIDFIQKSAKNVPETFVTALDRPGFDHKKFEKFVRQLGAKARFRPYLNEYEAS